MMRMCPTISYLLHKSNTDICHCYYVSKCKKIKCVESTDGIQRKSFQSDLHSLPLPFLSSKTAALLTQLVWMSDARKEKETGVEVTFKASILMPVGLRDQLFKLLVHLQLHNQQNAMTKRNSVKRNCTKYTKYVMHKLIIKLLPVQVF